jgi:hypothetical protein
VATRLVESVRGLIHQPAFKGSAALVGFNRATAGLVVQVIDGAGFVAVQVSPVACERDQIRHEMNVLKPPAKSLVFRHPGQRRDHRERWISREHDGGRQIKKRSCVAATLINDEQGITSVLRVGIDRSLWSRLWRGTIYQPGIYPVAAIT